MMRPKLPGLLHDTDGVPIVTEAYGKVMLLATVPVGALLLKDVVHAPLWNGEPQGLVLGNVTVKAVPTLGP
jgi:hypothetical protein